MPVLAIERETVPRPAPAAAVAAARVVLPGRHPLTPGRATRRRGLRVLGAATFAGLALIGFNRIADLWPSWPNPFATETVDRTGPAVISALSDLHRYEAATGSFSVTIDVERDARFLPSFIKGERTLYLAAGTVEAGVDFSGLGDGAVTVDGDRATLVLPRARLSEPRLDPEASYVADRDRGLLDRLGGVFSDSPTGERALQLEAEERLSRAAAEAGLVERAEANTTKMLTELLGGLGISDIEVRFEGSGTLQVNQLRSSTPGSASNGPVAATTPPGWRPPERRGRIPGSPEAAYDHRS